MSIASVAKATLIVAVVTYALVLVAMVTLQRRLMYHPDTARVSPAAVGLAGIEEAALKTADGETLVTWFSPAPAGRPTIVIFHGNGGALSYRARRIQTFQRAGFGLMVLSYRGYGGSTGAPTEAHNIADALMVYDQLVGRGVRPRDIVLFGESLGTGVATQVAAAREVAGLVLDSPYTSTVDVAARRYPWAPVRLLMWDRYETARHIDAVRAPILILHGEVDRVIPVDMARTLAAQLGSRAELTVYPGAEHCLHDHLGSLDRIARWIDARRG